MQSTFEIEMLSLHRWVIVTLLQLQRLLIAIMLLCTQLKLDKKK